MENLQKQVKLLTIYAAVLTLIVLGCIGFCMKLAYSSGHFDEITTGRINIKEPDGRLRMVISNRKSQHPGMVRGKEIVGRDRPAGMIFFNDEGDECGGLVYDGTKQSASMTYSIDQYQNDQIMQLQYEQEQDSSLQRSYGLKIWDRPNDFTLTKILAYGDSLKQLHNDKAYQAGINKLKASGKLGEERLFIGRNIDGEVGLFLSDASGKPRLRIFIDSHNQPVIQTLNEQGRVLSSK